MLDGSRAEGTGAKPRRWCARPSYLLARFLNVHDSDEAEGYNTERWRAETALERKRRGQTPAVTLTAHTRVEGRIQAHAAAFDMHVSKPVDPAEVVTVVERLAQRSRRA